MNTRYILIALFCFACVHLSTQEDLTVIRARADGGYHRYEIQACTMIRVPLDPRGVELLMTHSTNLDKIMLTTTAFSSCSEMLNFECPKGAEFCKVVDIQKSTTIGLEKEGCEHPVIYGYILPQNASQSLTFEMSIGVTTQANCESKNPVNTASMTDEEFCATLSPKTCKAETNACKSRCMWLSCKMASPDSTREVFSSCIPTSTTQDSLYKKCALYQEWANAPANQRVIDNPKCEKKLNPVGQDSVSQAVVDPNLKDGNSDDGPLSVVGLCIVIGLVLTLFCSCYYRYQVRNNKTELFTPPNWCPRFLFPRLHHEMNDIESMDL